MSIRLPVRNLLWLAKVISVLSLISGCFWDDEKEILVRDSLIAEYASLVVTQETLEQSDAGAKATFSAFIPAKNISEQLKTFVGAKIYPQLPPDGFEDIYILIEKFRLKGRDGYMALELDLAAISEEHDIEIGFQASSMLSVEEISDGVRSRPRRVRFGIHLNEVKPEFRWHQLKISSNELLTDWITVFASRALHKDQSAPGFELPVSAPLALNTSMYSRQSVVVNPEIKGSRAVLEISSTGAGLSRDLTASPAFLKEGALILLMDSAIEHSGDSGEHLSDEELKQEIVKLRSLVKAQKKNASIPKRGLSVMFDMAFVERLLSEYAQLPRSRRVININTLEYSGKIAEEGETYLRFAGNNPIQADIELSEVSASWKGDHLHFNVTAPAKLKLDTRLHLQFGNSLGGGIGKNLRLRDKISPTLEGRVAFQHKTFNGHEFMLLDTQLVCRRFKVSFKENGVFNLGYKSDALIGDQDVAPSLLLSDLPIYTNYYMKSLFTDDYYVVPPAKRIKHMPDPIGIDIKGSRVFLRFGLSTVADQSDDIVNYDALKEEAMDRLASSHTQCPGLRNPEFTIGPYAVGPNNEFIKFVQSMEKEYRKFTSDPVGSIVDTPGNIVNEAERGLNKLKEGLNTVKDSLPEIRL